MKLFKILAVFTLMISSISPTTLVYAVSTLTSESSEVASEETPTAEPQVAEEAVAEPTEEPVAEEQSTEPTSVEPQTESAIPVPELAVPSPQIPLPNLPQYREDLRRNGESSYRAAVQPGFNTGVSNLSELGPNVGDSISYSFTFPTHSLVYGNGSDWISFIVGNGNIGVAFVNRMHYGRNSYANNYQIGRTEVVEVGGASGDLSITSNHTINNNNFTMTMSGTITRTRVSNRTNYQLTAGIHNLVLGSTAVASGGEVPATPIEDVPISYLSIGNFTVSSNPYTLQVNDPGSFPLGQHTAVSSTYPGNTNGINYKQFINVLLDGVPIGQDDYSISAPDRKLTTIGTHQLPITVRISNGTVISQDIPIEVSYTDRDTIVFGNNYRWAPVGGAYRMMSSRIEAFAAEGNDVLDIIGEGMNSSNAYYSLGIFGVNSTILLNNLSGGTTKITHRVMGSSFKLQALDRWNNSSYTPTPGDLAVAYHAEGKIWLSKQGQMPDYTGSAQTEYFEILSHGQYRQLELHKLSVSEHEIFNGMTREELDQNVANYINVGTSGRVKVKGFVTYPDTATNGRKNGVIQVEEILDSGKTATYNYTVPFVVSSKLEVTAKTDNKVLLGTDMNTGDLRQFVDVVVDGEKLDEDRYEVEMTSAPIATDTVSARRVQSLRITVNETALSQEIPVAIEIIWGDSIVFGRFPLVSRTAAAFTLHHRENHPLITASKGWRSTGTSESIAPNYAGRDYYNFSWYDLSQKNSVDLKNDSAGQTVTAQGEEQEDDVLSRWTTQSVNYGDVVRSWVAVPAGNAVTENEQFVYNGGEVYYEITAGGYRALNISKLTPSSHMILQGTTKSELDSRLAEFLDVSSVEGVSLDKFIQYPDTSVVGTASGTIRVKETLSTGKIVSYDYEISFTVEAENTPPTADPIAQELYLGEALPDSPMDLLENISDDRDDPSALKATYQNRPDINLVGEMTASIQLEDSEGAVSIIEVPITIKWGSTISLRGLSDRTVGAYSLTRSTDGTLRLHSTFGDNRTNQGSQVHSYYGGSVYYSIEVFDGETSTYQYEVTGNAIIRNAVNGFNQGNPLEVSSGNVVKVYHAESNSRSRLMVNEVAENYSFGTPFSYYRVTDNGLVPIKHLEAEAVPQTFYLGENTDGRDLKDFVTDVQVNGVAVDASEYEISLRSEVNTTLIDTREVEVEIRTTDGLGILRTTVPYEVKWGSTISLRGLGGNTVGSYSLIKDRNGKLQLHSTFGDNSTRQYLNVHPYYANLMYYSIEVLDGETSTYQYEVTGNAVIRDAINGFNQGQPLEVSSGNIIKVYHAESRTRSRLMVNEVAENYSFGTLFSYYRVTDNGLVPIKQLEAEAVPQTFNLGESVDGRNLKELIRNVRVNGTVVDASEYEVVLLSDLNTTLVGTREVEAEVRTTDGLGVTQITIPYEVKWGSTLKLKGYGYGTVGVYSLNKNANGAMQIVTTKGEIYSLTSQVHQLFPDTVYYSIEVLSDGSRKFMHEVTGGMIVEDSINQFNNGSPLAVAVGDVVKVYHIEEEESNNYKNKNLLMENEQEKNYTYGTNYAYYKVTEDGFEPMAMLEAKPIAQEFILGEDTGKLDLHDLLEDVTLNGLEIPSDQYEVELLANFDTASVGTRNAKVKVTSIRSTASLELEIPYEVTWGHSIVSKTQSMNETLSAVSLLDNNGVPKLVATKGSGFSDWVQLTARPTIQLFTTPDLTVSSHTVSYVTVDQTPEELMDRWNSQLNGINNSLSYGDVLSHSVKKLDNLTNYNGANTWVSRDNQLVTETVGFDTAYYELTQSGLNLLHINQLKVETQTIENGLTEEELSQNIESYLSTDGFDTINVTKFIQYPDTSKAGTSNGIIEVEETLATGGTAKYNYTVPFIVENSTEWIDVKIPKKLLFGTSDVNKGVVSSPLYYIENAGTRNLKVSVEEINITNNTNNLELLRTADADPSAERAAAKLRMNYKTSNILVDLYESTPNQAVAELAPNEQTQFMIEGQYFGNYQQEVNIGLDIRYRFEVAS
ncbi:wall-associated protein [Enterococcus faecium]|nr:wall-associated protein [Enterococcus faecium]